MRTPATSFLKLDRAPSLSTIVIYRKKITSQMPSNPIWK